MTSTASRRSYGEGCLAAHALDLIGERWTLLIARELMLGPKRYGAIAACLPGAASNMLARRLSDMEAAGLLLRQGRDYALTPAGEGLWPVLAALCEVGRRMPGHDPRLPISPTSLVLSMRVTLGAPVEGAAADLAMQGERFAMMVRGGALAVSRNTGPDTAPLGFSGPANAMAAVIYGRAVPQAQALGVTLRGDPQAAAAFARMFSLAPG